MIFSYILTVNKPFAFLNALLYHHAGKLTQLTVALAHLGHQLSSYRRNSSVRQRHRDAVVPSSTQGRSPPKLPKNLSPVHLAVQQDIRARGLLPPGSKVLIAVSGGQDSLCLAAVLRDLRGAWDWTLHVAHCDHRWRTDSQLNAQHVEALAGAWGLPFSLQVAPEPPPKSEGQARTWRYSALLQLARQAGCSVVVTGHTATDRAETLLLNLMRGAGSDGMQALSWRRPLGPGVQLVRPLLGLSREQTGQVCSSLQLPVWLDSTNEDNSFRRNRVRNELLPYLRQHFNPRVDAVLSRSAEVLADEVQLLEEQAAGLLAAAAAAAGGTRGPTAAADTRAAGDTRAAAGAGAAAADTRAAAGASAAAASTGETAEVRAEPVIAAGAARSRVAAAAAAPGSQPATELAAVMCVAEAGSMAAQMDEALAGNPTEGPHMAVLDDCEGQGGGASGAGAHGGEDARTKARWCLDRRVLAAAPLALQRRAIRQVLLSLLPAQRVSHLHIEELLQLLSSPNGARAGSLAGGVSAQVQGDYLVVQGSSVSTTAGGAG